MTPRAAVVVALLALLAPEAARARTEIQGDYQLMLQLRKDLRAFPWDFDSNDDAVSNPFELRILALPRPGLEAFVKTQALWRQTDNNYPRPEFQFREAHMRLRREDQGRGVDAYLFTRERRLWVDKYLIEFVSDREATGIRVDTWGFLGANATLAVGDQSNQLDPSGLISDYTRRYDNSGGALRDYPRAFAPVDSLVRQASNRTDDFYVFRLRREFFADRRLRLGFTWNRYEGWRGRDSTSDRQEMNAVYGFDSRYRWRDIDFSLEYGVSRQQFGDVRDYELAFGEQSTGLHLPDRAVVQGEIRSIRLGTSRLGYLNITPGWWSRSPQYLNSLGGPGSDEVGFNLQSYYLLPDRAITISNQLLHYGKKNEEKRTRTREIYNEIYVEFVNGFTGKTSYRRTNKYETVRTRRTAEVVKDSYLSWTNELQVESRLAKLRVQSKVFNIGRPEQKQLFVIEPSMNLTGQLKLYNRYALGNDPFRVRKGVFIQVQYRPTGNMEAFLQYGPDNIGGGSNPVEDGNLSGSGDQYDEVKFILKGTF